VSGRPIHRATLRDLELAWSELSDHYLPVKSSDNLWRFRANAIGRLPRQGWKLHIAATILNASDILRTIGPVLSNLGMSFKAISTILDLQKLNSGLYYGYPQIGKCFTVYPQRPEETAWVARVLADTLRGVPAPAVPFETRVVEDSPVFARFGLFDSTTRMLQGPTGVEEPDSREANPAWASPPDGLFAPRIKGNAGLLLTTYRAYGYISQRGKGGVYRALDLGANPPRHCVLKEGRRHGEVDLSGNDGYSRVSREVPVLAELAASGVPVPDVFCTFVQSDNRYLVMEWMARGSLAELLFSFDGVPVELVKALEMCAEAAHTLGRINGCGWVWRDLKADNFLIDGRGKLRPIDFEGAVRSGSTVTGPWGSPGHVPPEWADTSRASVAQDKYALGVLVRQLLTNESPLAENRPPLRELNARIPATVERLASRLMHPCPEMRPSANLAASIFERAVAEVSIGGLGGLGGLRS
jgi:hypothetical protein